MSSSNSERPDLLEVGRIGKAHGLRGDLAVTFSTNLVEARTSKGATLDAEGRPLVVVSARPHSGEKWLVSFEGVTSREQADLLRGKTLKAEPLELEPPAGGVGPKSAHGTQVVALVHELIGSRLIDQHGTDHGEVLSVLDNPASDILELAGGRLVPLTFYVAHDADNKTVSVDVPAGLLDDDAEVVRDSKG